MIIDKYYYMYINWYKGNFFKLCLYVDGVLTVRIYKGFIATAKQCLSFIFYIEDKWKLSYEPSQFVSSDVYK